MGIHRTYPYPAYGGLAPVPGGQGEQRDDIADPIGLSANRVGKGLKLKQYIELGSRVPTRNGQGLSYKCVKHIVSLEGRHVMSIETM